MQQRDKKSVAQEQPGQAPEFEQLAVPAVDGLLKELETTLEDSRLADVLRAKELLEARSRMRYLMTMDEGCRRYSQEMYYRDRIRNDKEELYRLGKDYHSRSEFSRCTVGCKCRPCREGACYDCTEEGGRRDDRYASRDEALKVPPWDSWNS
jgi:hypothetical protein